MYKINIKSIRQVCGTRNWAERASSFWMFSKASVASTTLENLYLNQPLVVDFFIFFHCLAFKTLQILGRSWCFSWLLIGFQTLFSCFSQVSPFSQCCYSPAAPSGKNLRPVTGGLLNQTSEVCSSRALYCPNVLENALELVVWNILLFYHPSKHRHSIFEPLNRLIYSSQMGEVSFLLAKYQDLGRTNQPWQHWFVNLALTLIHQTKRSFEMVWSPETQALNPWTSWPPMTAYFSAYFSARFRQILPGPWRE